MNHQILIFGVVIMALSIDGKALSDNKAAMTAVSQGINDFANKFHKTVAKEVTGNYISSPLSLNILLTMATAGAEGTTKSELEQALSSHSDEAIRQSGYQGIIKSLNNTEDIQLTVANKIYTAKNYKLKDEYKQVSRNFFGSEIESLDFSKAEESAKNINDWAAAHTNNRINKIVKPDNIKSASMVLLNAVHFKGAWQTPFDTSATRSMPFHIDEKSTKNVNMMKKKDYYNWGAIEDLNAKYIEIPYENTDFSMFIILPNEIDGIDQVEKNFEKVNYAQFDEDSKPVILYLPKFKIETEMDLKPILQKMNINEMFGNSANFRGITETDALTASSVYQKTFIDVNEFGTEAAAVTQMSMVGSSPNAVEPPKFIVDRPFIAAIVASGTGSKIELFHARMLGPQ